MSMLFNHQLPFFVVYSMSSSCNRQITLCPCLHVFYSTSDQFISGFDSYMSTMVIFADKLFSRLFQDYNPSTSTLLPLASVYIKYFRQIIFLMVLIPNFLVCINLQNLNNPHTCSVTHFFLFNDCHASLRGPQDLNAVPGVGEGGFLKLLNS